MIRRVMAGIGLVYLGGCGGDSTGPSAEVPAELVATWVAEPACLAQGCSFTVFNRANPADSVNFVQFGFAVEMAIQASGQMSMQVRLQSDALLNGTLRVRDGRMLVTAAGSATVDTLDYTLANDRLAIELRSQLHHDLNGDGQQESVGLRGTFRRR